MDVKGRIVNILDVESGTSKAGKEWKKQGFVIDTGDQYNPNVCFSLFGDDKIGMLNSYSVGQDVSVSFNLSSREFNGKWYHNVDAWKIEATAGQGEMPPAPGEPPVEEFSKEEDDLPF
ncbi:DUF3127 domain-containing protein [Flavobacteriales bacterium]|jgi:hypothetical protein|nr:DUF3127 domain-containing protein [Flavobacteriales bacterium]